MMASDEFLTWGKAMLRLLGRLKRKDVLKITQLAAFLRTTTPLYPQSLFREFLFHPLSTSLPFSETPNTTQVHNSSRNYWESPPRKHSEPPSALFCDADLQGSLVQQPHDPNIRGRSGSQHHACIFPCVNVATSRAAVGKSPTIFSGPMGWNLGKL